MNYRRLEYFLAVAEEGHFGRAAARLRIAQPPLSQQIQKLEAELGVKLFNRRRGRPVELTDAGRVLMQEGARALAQADRAADAARRAAAGEIGHLRVGFAPSTAIDVLPPLVRTFTTRFPDVSLALHELQSERQADHLRTGDLDVGLVRPPLDARGLKTSVLAVDPLLVALPDWHPLAAARSVRMRELRDESFVLAPRATAPAWHDHILSLCRAAGFSPSIVQEVETIQTRLGLVAANVGVSIVPGSVTSLTRAGVTMVPLEGPHVALLLAWAPKPGSAVLDSFLLCAKETALRTDPPGARRARQTS